MSIKNVLSEQSSSLEEYEVRRSFYGYLTKSERDNQPPELDYGDFYHQNDDFSIFYKVANLENEVVPFTTSFINNFKDIYKDITPVSHEDLSLFNLVKEVIRT